MSDCINTTWSKTVFGYGHRWYQGRYELTHRIAWIEEYGEIPTGMCVLHHCDNPACVNPEHLYLGTKKDNAKDMAHKGRQWQQLKTHCAQGHEFTEDNIYRSPNRPLHRVCRECRRLRGK